MDKIIIAVDFDDTLCKTRITSDKRILFGKANKKLIEMLKGYRDAGHIVILWTCRGGDRLKRAVEWCKKRGLEFDKVNENADEIEWEDSRKILADIYIDDKGMPPEAFVDITENMVMENK